MSAKTRSIRPRTVTGAEIRRIAHANMARDVVLFGLACLVIASLLYGGARGFIALANRFPRFAVGALVLVIGSLLLGGFVGMGIDIWRWLDGWREDCFRRARWTAEENDR